MENNQPDFYLTFVEVCHASGLPPQAVREYQSFGLFPVHPAPDPEHFNPAEITHLQLVQRLREDLDINLEGIEVILRMRRQMLDLERTVNRMRHQLNTLERQHFQRLYLDQLGN